MIKQCQRGDDTNAELSTPHAAMPPGPSARRSAIQSNTLSLGPKYPNPVSLRSSDAPPCSGLISLNSTIAHTKKPHLASSVALAGFAVFDFPARDSNRTLLHMISTELSSLIEQNTSHPFVPRCLIIYLFFFRVLVTVFLAFCEG
jgi:hypothetical protein